MLNILDQNNSLLFPKLVSAEKFFSKVVQQYMYPDIYTVVVLR